MATVLPVFAEGSFEYIEAKIRRDAEGTSFSGDFEWLCQWFLEHAPRYRGQFDKIWRWKDWPEKWGADAGIDLVARTKTGQLWAIQSKADHPDRAIPKREIDSFLSESNRPQFAYRLLWEERQLLSVANLTRQDAVEFLDLAPRAKVRTTTTVYPLDHAKRRILARSAKPQAHP